MLYGSAKSFQAACGIVQNGQCCVFWFLKVFDHGQPTIDSRYTSLLSLVTTITDPGNGLIGFLHEKKENKVFLSGQ